MRQRVRRVLTRGSGQAGLLALATLLWIGLSMILARETQASPLQQRFPPPSPGSPCSTYVCPGGFEIFAQHSAAPGALFAGEALTVSIAAFPIHIRSTTPLHIMLVVDMDATVAKSDLHELRQSLLTLMKQIDLANNPETLMGLVLVDERAQVVVPLTNEEPRLRRALGRIEAEGDLRLDLGLEASLSTLRRARPEATLCRIYVSEIVIAIAPEPSDPRCPHWVRAARKLKDQGILVVSVCASPRCKARCAIELASSYRYYYDLKSLAQFAQVVDRLRDEILNITLRSLEIVEHLSPELELIPESVYPPATLNEEGTRLSWQVNFVPKTGITFTYRSRVSAEGDQAASAGSLAIWRDNQNRCIERELRSARVTAFGSLKRIEFEAGRDEVR